MANRVQFRRSDTNELLLDYNPEDSMIRFIGDELYHNRAVEIQGKFYFRRVTDLISVTRDSNEFETMVIPVTETTVTQCTP